MICRVGYALNPKKLRKSGSDVLSTPSVQTTAAQTSSAHANCSNICELKATGFVWRGGGLADIISDGIECNGVKFIPWNYELPLSKQPEFDVIIHKLTEDIDRKESAEKINALNAYLAAHPQTSIVDPLEAVRKVISRARCCESLAKIINKLGTNCPFTQPRFVLVDVERENLADYIQELMAIEGFTFPVICKPVEACGTPNSHRMAVVVSQTGFGSMTPPFIVQEYRDHNESFFKVYVIDNEVMVFRRPSLPNIDDLAVLAGNVRNPHNTYDNVNVPSGNVRDGNVPSTSGTNGEGSSHYVGLRSVAFDSRYAYPTASDFQELSNEGDDILNENESKQEDKKRKDEKDIMPSTERTLYSNLTNTEGTNTTSSISVLEESNVIVCDKLWGLNILNKSDIFHEDKGSPEVKEMDETAATNSLHLAETTNCSSPPISTPPIRERLSRLSVLSLEGRARKPSAIDMPLESLSSSPSSSLVDLLKAQDNTVSSYPSNCINGHENENGIGPGNKKEQKKGCKNGHHDGQSNAHVVAQYPPALLGPTNANHPLSETELQNDIPRDGIKSNGFDEINHKNEYNDGGKYKSTESIIVDKLSCIEGDHDGNNGNNGSSGRIEDSVSVTERIRENNNSVINYRRRMRSLSLNEDKFRQAAMAIKKEFGLSLFGFDLIVPVRSDAYSTKPECCCGSENEIKNENEIVEFNKNGEEMEGRDDCKSWESSSKFQVQTVDSSDSVKRDIEPSASVGAGREGVVSDSREGETDDKDTTNRTKTQKNGLNITRNKNKNKNWTANDDIELVVIDVNYFPSYKEVPDFPQKLRKFLRSKAGMEVQKKNTPSIGGPTSGIEDPSSGMCGLGPSSVIIAKCLDE